MLGLALLIFAAFVNSLDSGMVLDNQFIIQGDTRLREPTRENVSLIFSEDYWYPSVGRLYRPLTTLSFLFNYAVLGNQDAPAGYHVVNLGLHLLNASLVYLLMLRLFGSAFEAASVAALFAVHPVTVESVTNIVGRADLFAAASVLGGLLIYIRSKRSTWWRMAWWALLAVVGAIGVLCKENAIVIAGLVPLYDLTYGPTGRSLFRERWREWANLARGYAAVLPAIAIMVWVRVRLFPRWDVTSLAFVDNPIRAADFLTGQLTAIKVVGKYLWLMLFPLRLSCDYSFDQIPVFGWGRNGLEDWKVAVALAAVAVLLALAVWGFVRKRTLFFLILFFFITLLPTSNLLVLVDSIMAERFLYLPLVGFLGCVVLGMSALSWPPRTRYAVLGALVVALGVRTLVRNADWRSNISLWTSAQAVSPRSFRVHRSVAWHRFKMDPDLGGGFDAIMREADAATSVLDSVPPVQRDKLSYLVSGEIARTRAEQLARKEGAGAGAGRLFYRKAAHVLKQARTIDRLQNERHRRMNLERGRDPFEIRDVGLPAIYENLGAVLSALGRFEAALAAYRYMVHLDPTATSGYSKLADEEVALGHYDRAAIRLMQLALMGERGPALGERVRRVYRLLDEGGVPAVVQTGDEYQLNVESPLVYGHVCAAAQDLTQIALEAKRVDIADGYRQVGRDNQCDMRVFDEMWRRRPGNWRAHDREAD